MQLSAEKIWDLAQEHLRSKLSRDTYNMWFAPLHAGAVDGHHLTLETPNEFSGFWLKDNYLGLLQDALAVAAGRQLQVKFKSGNGSIPAAAPAAIPVKAKTAEPAHERSGGNHELHFNPKNTFETFVVGNNNNFAHAAALAVDSRLTNSDGATVSLGEAEFVYANSNDFRGGYRTSRQGIDCAVIGEDHDAMQRDFWYTSARSADDLLAAEAVGRIAGERTARRLNARALGTLECAVLFEAPSEEATP